MEVLRVKLPVDLTMGVPMLAAALERYPEATLRYGRNGHLIVDVAQPELPAAD
jgi:hypothetical protein